jgi:hypothetical protein
VYSTAYGQTARDDFAKWYAEWLEIAPKNYEVTFTNYFKLKPGVAPRVMKTTKWVEPPYRLTVIENSGVKKDFRFLENPKYCATIEAAQSAKPAWSVSELILRDSSHYGEKSASIADNFGTRLNLGLLAGTFDRLFKQEPVSQSGPPGKQIAEILISFEKTPQTKERDIAQMSISLDEASSWAPVEIRKVEAGGIKSRFAFSGWHQAANVWVPRDVTVYIQLPSEKSESIHSKEAWSFPPDVQIPGSQSECYLTYYGIHEPEVPLIGTWGIVAVVAVLLLILGYRISKRRAEAMQS